MQKKLIRNKYKQGIVLITTMLTVVLVIMLLSSVVYSNLGSMRLASNFYGREEALMAAQSGVEYAITCLQSDITWRGDKTDNTLSDSSKGINVRERNGNVVGMITTANGNRSFFRIKFNYEDGDKGFDGLSNSSDSDRIQSPYVSVNNLFNTTPTKVYTASQDGKLKTKQYKDKYGKTRVGVDGASSFSLGKSSCYLVVEGFAGNGVRDLTLDKAFTLTAEEAAKLMPRRVETYLALASDSQFTDSVACAAGDLNTESKIIRISNAKGSTSPKMRSLHNLTVKSETVDFDNGQLYYGSGYTYNINGKTVGEDSKYTAQQSDDKSSFTRLEWDDITKANSKGQRYEKINAGTYVWSKNPETGKNVLKRYVDDYPPGTKIPSDAKCYTVSNLPGVTIDADTLTMKVKSNLWVTSDGKASSFIIRYEKEGETATSRPVVAFLKNEANNTSPILSSDHDIYIEGASLGGGSITSKKNISLQGPSILESDPGIGVSIYAQGDVNLLPIESVTEQIKKVEPDKFNSSTENDGDSDWILINEHGEYDNEILDIYNIHFNPTLQNIMYNSFPPESVRRLFPGGFDLGSPVSRLFEEWCETAKQFYSGKKNGVVYDQPFVSINDGDFQRYSYEYGLDITAVKLAFSAFTNESRVYLQQYLEDAKNWKQIGNSNNDNTNQNAEVDLSPKDISDVQNYIDKDLASDNFRDTKESQLTDLMLRYGKIKYSDQDISGVIYAWGNINANIGENSTLNLTGAMVAYGGDPKEKTPGKNNKGAITINAGTIGMTLDPDYMGAFLAANAKRKVKQVMFSNF